jgi:hypothetical protein
MKKIILTIAIAFTIQAGFAQTALQKAKTAAQTGTTVANAFGVSTPDVLAKLTPALNLTAVQKPKVLAAVTSFAKDKAGILSLAKTDNASYLTKLAGLQGGLFAKLKTALTAAQYAKFLGLKPTTATTANALSSLFF